ncbi:MAG: hypothetical protein AAGF90_23570, partial [Pseudomonadota bacterium]
MASKGGLGAAAPVFGLIQRPSQISSLSATPPPGGWTALIDEICEGRWINPKTGAAAPRPPFDAMRIEESLEGAEADLVADLKPEGEIAVVADEDTWDAMGGRIAAALSKRFGGAREVVFAR